MAVYFVDYENVHDAGLEGIGALTKEDRVVIFYGINIKSIPFDRHIEIMNSKAEIEYIKTDKVAKNYLDFQLATYLGYVIGVGEKAPIYIISKDTGFDSIVDYWSKQNINISRHLHIDISIDNAEKVAEKAKKDVKKGTKDTKPESKQNKQETQNKQDDKQNKQENKQNKQAVKQSQKQAKSKEKVDNSELKKIPEALRKRIRNSVKKENLQAAKYTYIYKAMIKSKNHPEYKENLLSLFGTKQGEVIYNHTQNIYGELLNLLNTQE